MTGTRLARDRYLELLHVEGERFMVAAQDVLAEPVPTCPGWTVDDLVFHLGGVYAHKVAVLRSGARPTDWDLPADDASAEDDLAWCHAMLHSLAAELRARPWEERTWTWSAADQTVGFWVRRMALETAVHRADAEAATGPITPLDVDLALDGIDEVLALHLADSGAVSALVASGPTVYARVDEVEVEGAASDVALWLWGRLPDEAVRVSGTPERRRGLRRLLETALQ